MCLSGSLEANLRNVKATHANLWDSGIWGPSIHACFFSDNKIDGEALAEFTESDLKTVFQPKLAYGDYVKLRKVVEKMKSTAIRYNKPPSFYWNLLIWIFATSLLVGSGNKFFFITFANAKHFNTFSFFSWSLHLKF